MNHLFVDFTFHLHKIFQSDLWKQDDAVGAGAKEVGVAEGDEKRSL